MDLSNMKDLLYERKIGLLSAQGQRAH